MGINIIAAIGKNNELGKDNKLIWTMPKDLRFFKQMTLDKTIIMGRKTFESLPNKLPRRNNVVISSRNLEQFCDVICFNDLLEALMAYSNEDVFVIGGQSIYTQALEFTDTMYLTEVNEEELYADAYFPSFNKHEWNVKELESGIDNGIEYTRKKYVRKRVK